jgi:hypothetical protein
MAYGATGPDVGSDLAALKTTAVPVSDRGKVVGYRLSGQAVDLERGRGRADHGARTRARGSELVRRRRRRSRAHTRRSRQQARDSPHKEAPIFDVGTTARPSDLFDVLPALAEQLRAVSA